MGRCLTFLCVVTGVLVRGRQEVRGSLGDAMVEEDVGMRCFGDGGKGRKPRNVGRLQKLEKARRQRIPWSLQWEHSP